MKLLCPLLDNVALEEDEFLQDKWSILLSNLVDSDQNIENHVFPYILGQISSDEYLYVEQASKSKKLRVKELTAELIEFLDTRVEVEEQLKKALEELKAKIAELRARKEYSSVSDLNSQKAEKDSELSRMKYIEGGLRYRINAPQAFPESEIKEYEMSNLIRLGLARLVQEPYANRQTLEIPNNPNDDYLTVDLDVEVESNFEHVLTELGELFVDACTEKHLKVQI